ncbi:DUF4304 domain-containing protein [Flavobacterium chungbukense]|uniref:DUF4304 domain-containing protein n=1 Tax=Flavobacterium chungbukense TaxID=877464 RepID=A0ABP7YQQ0_9FLAO|nr:DUF4304 domain-containing protein [Flavobacterium chungbukense]MCC4919634.1 DUF4304 domain-containing protein [Flavobacterium chungbukense]
MEKNIQLEFDEILKNLINPFFKKRGFKKQGNNFNKKINNLVQVINIQKSRQNQEDNVSFTINIGFFDIEIYLENSSQIPKFIHDYDCQIRFRIGSVVHGNDYWYELTQKTKKEDLEIEIHYDLTNSLIPIFEKVIDLNHLKDFILKNEVVQITTTAIYKIKIFIKTNEFKKAEELLQSEYHRALNPKDYVSKTILPDGTEIIKTSKSAINTKYLEILKKIAETNGVVL